MSQYLQKLKREIWFSHNYLSVIAMLSMLIDHAAFTLIKNGKLYGYDDDLYQNAIAQDSARFWLAMYTVMRCIGRIAFPLFAFLIVEGFRKTSNLFKYILRLLILALISEIPYDLMVFNEFMTLRCTEVQNVVFTYLIGILMLVILRLIKSIPQVFTVIPAGVAAVLAFYLKTDYAIWGILIMYFCYMLRHDLNAKCLSLMLITFVMSINHYYGAAALSVFFIYFYDGKKGYFDLKRFPYLFYPLHMLFLYGIIYIANWRN